MLSVTYLLNFFQDAGRTSTVGVPLISHCRRVHGSSAAGRKTTSRNFLSSGFISLNNVPPFMDVEILDEQFGLYPQKAVFWKSRDTLLLSDLHLGKINHFRRAGIPVPAKANDHNLEIFIDLVNACKPKRIVCLGDLFHSHYNAEWEVFGEVIRYYSDISFELVVGNHDIMGTYQYKRKGIELHDTLRIGAFLLTHHPLETIPEGSYNIAGHIHPGVSLKGKGRQSMTLPCFYFSATQAYLPAFGKFTGLARIAPKKEDKVFIVAENKVICVA